MFDHVVGLFWWTRYFWNEVSLLVNLSIKIILGGIFSHFFFFFFSTTKELENFVVKAVCFFFFHDRIGTRDDFAGLGWLNWIFAT